jgi:hypothetical protein
MAGQPLGGAQVSESCVHAPLAHEYEQAPVKPLSQVPDTPPLSVALSEQVPSSLGAQGAGAQVLETCVHIPALHVYEQLPAYPSAHAPEAPPSSEAPSAQ